MTGEQKRRLRALIQKYEQGLDFYRRRDSGYNETDARVEFIDPILELLGWDVNNSRGVAADLREVIREESQQVEGSASKPDYTLRRATERRCFVEAKKPSVRVETEPDPAIQARRYGYTAGHTISVLTNFHTLSVYDTRHATQPTDTAAAYLVLTLDYTDFESRWDEIEALIGRDSVQSDAWLSGTELSRGTAALAVNELFVAQYNSWRLRLADALLARDRRMGEDLINDVVQRLLNRLIFVRMCEDRGIEGAESLLKAADSLADLTALFERLDRRYNTGLFDQSQSNAEPIRLLDEKPIADIVNELYSPFSAISFAVLDAEFLGMVYETSLAEHVIVDRTGRTPKAALAPKKEYAAREVVTTPQPLVDMAVELAMTSFAAASPTGSPPATLDFASGSGRFLLASFKWIIQEEVNRLLGAGNTSGLRKTSSSDWTLPFASKCKILRDCIFGIDIDYMAVEITRFSLLIHLLEDETSGSLPRGDRILPDLKTNVIHGNTLVRSLPPTATSAQLDLTRPLPLPRAKFPKKFDVIVGNPPYVKTETIKSYDRLEYDYLKSNYDLLHKQFDKYLAFVQFAWEHLTDNGFLGVVIPNKWMTNVSGEVFRERIIDRSALRYLINFGDVQLFPDKTIYVCVLVLGQTPQAFSDYDEPGGFP